MDNKDLEQRAIKKAVSPFNFVLSPTTSALKDLNVTRDGPVVIGNGLIEVPVDVFMFSSFRSYKARVIINEGDLSLIKILKQSNKEASK